MKDLLKRLGIQQNWLASEIGRTPNIITYHLNKEFLGADFLIKVGKALRRDLSADFPKLKGHPDVKELNFFNASPKELMAQVTEIREMHEAQLQVTADQKAEIAHLNVRIKDLEKIIASQNDMMAGKDDIITLLKTQLEEK